MKLTGKCGLTVKDIYEKCCIAVSPKPFTVKSNLIDLSTHNFNGFRKIDLIGKQNIYNIHIGMVFVKIIHDLYTVLNTVLISSSSYRQSQSHLFSADVIHFQIRTCISTIYV